MYIGWYVFKKIKNIFLLNSDVLQVASLSGNPVVILKYIIELGKDLTIYVSDYQPVYIGSLPLESTYLFTGY